MEPLINLIMFWNSILENFLNFFYFFLNICCAFVCGFLVFLLCLALLVGDEKLLEISMICYERTPFCLFWTKITFRLLFKVMHFLDSPPPILLQILHENKFLLFNPGTLVYSNFLLEILWTRGVARRVWAPSNPFKCFEQQLADRSLIT